MDLQNLDRNTLVMIGVGILVLIIVIAVIASSIRKKRSMQLREKFGPEYDAVVAQRGNASKAEAELASRQTRVEKFTLRALPSVERDRYMSEWAAVQRRFVDDPAFAVNEADALVTQVMSARGYPMSDFEQRSADISVHHPRVVQNYRSARAIVVRHGQGQASTEDLRQAMVHCRGLFEELLESAKVEVPRTEVREVGNGRVAS